MFGCRYHPGRFLGMPGGAVVGAAGIVKQEHGAVCEGRDGLCQRRPARRGVKRGVYSSTEKPLPADPISAPVMPLRSILIFWLF
jgi:hypothetical protein